MTTDEAREAAWREFLSPRPAPRTYIGKELGAFNAGWNARGQHDAPLIAALHGILYTWRAVEDTAHHGAKVQDEAQRLLRKAISIARDLAGQPEEATG